MSEQSLKEDCVVSLPEQAGMFDTDTVSDGEPPHRVEVEVRRHLLSDPSLSFSSLVVHRIKDGVCLKGVVELETEAPDVGDLARRVSGVSKVLNQLVVASRCATPLKG